MPSSVHDELTDRAPRVLLVRADASPAIGSGHVMRCLALAKAWQASGGSVAWLSAEAIPALEERLLQEGVALKSISTAAGSQADAECTVAHARNAKAEWVVVDGYRFDPGYVRELKRATLRVLFLDDDGRFDFYASDAVLNQNISASTAMYERREPFTRLLLGSEYVLLRPEFLAESRRREQPASARKVLVTMGGSDPDNVTEKVLLALSRMAKDYEAKVVVGSGYSHAGGLEKFVERMSPRVCLEKNPANMAPLMQWADVAISAAGSTCWELAYLGLPSIVIALSEDQLVIARGLAEHDIAVNLGWHANLSEDRIGDALLRLSDDNAERLAMSERGREFVDGRGATRVVQFLQNSL